MKSEPKPKLPSDNNKKLPTATLVFGVMLVLFWGVLFYATHIPLPPGLLPGNSDKMIHTAAYFVLAVLLLSFLATKGPFTWWAVFIRWIVLAAYGAFDEVTQTLVSRTADIEDWFADITGAALGLCLTTAVVWFWRRINRRDHLTSVAAVHQSPVTE